MATFRRPRISERAGTARWLAYGAGLPFALIALAWTRFGWKKCAAVIAAIGSVEFVLSALKIWSAPTRPGAAEPVAVAFAVAAYAATRAFRNGAEGHTAARVSAVALSAAVTWLLATVLLPIAVVIGAVTVFVVPVVVAARLWYRFNEYGPAWSVSKLAPFTVAWGPIENDDGTGLKKRPVIILEGDNRRGYEVAWCTSQEKRTGDPRYVELSGAGWATDGKQNFLRLADTRHLSMAEIDTPFTPLSAADRRLAESRLVARHAGSM